jgi:hypothetical protein
MTHDGPRLSAFGDFDHLGVHPGARAEVSYRTLELHLDLGRPRAELSILAARARS